MRRGNVALDVSGRESRVAGLSPPYTLNPIKESLVDWSSAETSRF